MNRLAVPYFGNPDNTHCFQAVIRIVLKYFFPTEEYTWDQLDKLTGKKPDKWTWRSLGLLDLQNRGMEIINWSNFDQAKFVEEGAEYLIEFYGPEKARIQIEHCDLDYEIENVRKTLNILDNRLGLPDISDLKVMLEAGYLLICNVNSKILNNEIGYSGHFVLVYEVTEDHIVMHDPGPPHFPERKITHEWFRKAWKFPNINARNLIAIRLVGDILMVRL